MVIRSTARMFALAFAAALLAACASGQEFARTTSAQPAAFVGAVPAAQNQVIDDEADAFWDNIQAAPILSDVRFEEQVP